MNTGKLENTKDIKPLLVKLQDLSQNIKSEDHNSDIERKRSYTEISEVVSNILSTKVSDDENIIITEILINLIKQAHRDLRSALSARIAMLDYVPEQLALKLAYDEADIADPILQKSRAVNDLDLMYIIQSRDAPFWRSIAKREHNMHPSLIDTLADLDDIETTVNLAENKNIVLTDYALENLTQKTKNGAHEVGKPLLSRPDIPDDFARELYEIVGKTITDTLDEDQLSDASKHSINETINEFVETKGPKQTDYDMFMPSASILEDAQASYRAGFMNISLLVENLKRKQMKTFVALFSAMANISCRNVIEMLQHPYGQGLALVCKAHDVQKSDFMRLYLLTQPIRSGQNTTDSSNLGRVVATFEKMSRDKARELLNL